MVTDDIIWNGRTYRRHPRHPDRHRRVYYAATSGLRAYLHRDIYEAMYGPIPIGWHVHHGDGDPLNNEPSNLVALSASEHAKLHYAERDLLPYRCLHCGTEFMSRKATRNIKWCSPRCKEAARRAAGLVKPQPKHPAPILTRDCAECGERFTSTKAWATYCTSACKQRSGRRRQRQAAA